MDAEATLLRARAGDEGAFRALTDPYRRELQVHCYRMVGSLHDAEDMLQETLLAAWRGLEGFEGRASLRAWLYRIATNRCLNWLRDRERRPRALAPGLPYEPPPATRMSELTWLEPYPDVLLEGVPDAAPGPEAVYETREAIGLAFITALARLSDRQRAVLVLRDVLGFRATEVASMLDVSEATVNSALVRAREAVEARVPQGSRERAVAPGSARERELAGAFADAFAAGELDRVVAMLTDDAWVTMPPDPYEYQGRDAIGGFFTHVGARRTAGGRTRLLPTRANGVPAFGHYMAEEGEPELRPRGLLVLEMAANGITLVTRFGGSDLPGRCGLPERLSG